MAHTITLELSLYQAQVLKEFTQHLITDMPDIQTADEEEPYNDSVKTTLGAILIKINEAQVEAVKLAGPYKKTKKKKK